MPARRRMPAELRARHDSLVSAFLAEKQFVGCNGLVVTDEIRATIAALACLLVLGRRGHYDALHSILVYPSAFWVEDEVEDEAGVVEKRRRVLSGEAWESSRIILSWEDVLEAARFPGEGYNVALHEFAHYLDAEGLGLADPPQPSAARIPGRAPSPTGPPTSSTSSNRCSMPSIAARTRSSIRTRPRTAPSSSPSPPRTSSSVPMNSAGRIRGCMRCCGSSTGSIPQRGSGACCCWGIRVFPGSRRGHARPERPGFPSPPARRLSELPGGTRQLARRTKRERRIARRQACHFGSAGIARSRDPASPDPRVQRRAAQLSRPTSVRDLRRSRRVRRASCRVPPGSSLRRRAPGAGMRVRPGAHVLFASTDGPACPRWMTTRNGVPANNHPRRRQTRASDDANADSMPPRFAPPATPRRAALRRR